MTAHDFQNCSPVRTHDGYEVHVCSRCGLEVEVNPHFGKVHAADRELLDENPDCETWTARQVMGS